MKDPLKEFTQLRTAMIKHQAELQEELAAINAALGTPVAVSAPSASSATLSIATSPKGRRGPRKRAENSLSLPAEWVRPFRDHCVTSRVPFFFKQWGGVRKHVTGRHLDGRTWDELPPVSPDPLPPLAIRRVLAAELAMKPT